MHISGEPNLTSVKATGMKMPGPAAQEEGPPATGESHISPGQSTVQGAPALHAPASKWAATTQTKCLMNRDLTREGTSLAVQASLGTPMRKGLCRGGVLDNGIK